MPTGRPPATNWRPAPAPMLATCASGWAAWRPLVMSSTTLPVTASGYRRNMRQCWRTREVRSSRVARSSSPPANSSNSLGSGRRSVRVAACPRPAYGDDLWRGQERFSAGWVNHLLTQVWIPAMPEVLSRLERGAAVADVGCGRGLALIKLAQVYPNSYFVGYDAFEPEVTQATANAEAAGVTERVRFQHLDASDGLPAQYDLITTFDVVHDAVNPHALLGAIRQALTPDGRYVCLETNCSDKLEDNTGPLGALFHGISLFYCLPTSLAHGGAGLGTLGLPETRLRQLCLETGFEPGSACAAAKPVQHAVRDSAMTAPAGEMADDMLGHRRLLVTVRSVDCKARITWSAVVRDRKTRR